MIIDEHLFAYQHSRLIKLLFPANQSFSIWVKIKLMKLQIEKLTKTYANGVKALSDVSLEIGNGMFGLLGPNGAGKSSLMRTLVTLQDADQGSVFLNDIDAFKYPDEMRRHIGYLPQEFGVYPKIHAEAMLDHFAALKGFRHSTERKSLVKELLVKTNLYEHRHKKLGEYSGGMKQRFGIAQALIGNPKLIIVDEPTAGLDPSERNRFHNLLSELGSDAIVILSTHIVEDVKNLCTDMAILDRGVIKLRTSPAKAIESIKNKVWEKAIDREEIQSYKQDFQVISERVFDGSPIIKIYSEAQPAEGFYNPAPDLEDVYFSIISNHQSQTVVS